MLKQLVLLACALCVHADSITGCHRHGSTLYCIDTNGDEGYVTPGPEGSIIPKSYTACSTDGDDVVCATGTREVTFVVETGVRNEASVAEASLTSASSSAATTSAASSDVTNAITDCHFHGTTQFCLDASGNEGYVSPAPTNTASAPSSYTACHSHGSDTYCMKDDNDEVRFVVEGVESAETSAVSAASSASASSVSAQTTAVTDCHFHGTTQFCVNGAGVEGHMTPAPTNTADAPASYTGCHAHETATFCLDTKGNEVQFVAEEVAESASASGTAEMDCHFHAGVEHCVPVGGGENSRAAEATCERQDRDYNIPLRVGTLFAVLVTSLAGAFLPIFIKKFFNAAMNGIIFMTLKQFGTGVIISTALVHLATHALLMFNNECLTGVQYEATTAAVIMAGLFISFVAEYICNRVLLARQNKLSALPKDSEGSEDDLKAASDDQITDVHQHDHHAILVHTKDKVSVWLLEAGIIFHSVLIGVTLVVAGDSYYITLFIVIIFHQAFEGIALASRIAELDVSIWYKLLMASAFAITTPIGMAIGTGVITKFNGNDPSTIIAIGTLDAFSAGILLWVGIIEMWSHDWLHGPLSQASWPMVGCSLFGLIAGMVLMSFLGKWA